MQHFFDRLQEFLDSRASTLLLLAIVLLLSIAAGWGAYQYISDERATSESQSQRSEYSENNAIIRHLPHRTSFYSISYDKRGTDPVMIKIFTESPYYRSQALQYLMDFDQEVTIKHPIEFVDYTSPIELGEK